MCDVSPVVHTSNISSCKKKIFFSFPEAVNSYIKVGEHYETPCIICYSKCLNTDQRNPINCTVAATADVISTNRGQPSVEVC